MIPPPRPARRLVTAATGAFVVAALAAGVSFGAAALDGEHRRSTALVTALRPDYVGNDRLAPDFTLRDRAGRPLRLSSLRGRTVVLHFWSRECPPCIEELAESLPAFDELVQGAPELALVLVSVDANWDAIAPLIPPSIRAPIVFDPDRAVVERRYGTKLFPETWIIDPRGVIRARFDRTLDWTNPALLSFVRSL
ncbi:MAG: Thiosulfate sulfurtransferase, rhodanese [Myxococcaceae bacterium]|nr:Thiosulfate sulfurtransferase, rhodanese [Myxococcaceae bacterium]